MGLLILSPELVLPEGSSRTQRFSLTDLGQVYDPCGLLSRLEVGIRPMERRREDGTEAAAGDGGGVFAERRHEDDVHDSSKSAWYLFLLTVSIGGQVSSLSLYL